MKKEIINRVLSNYKDAKTNNYHVYLGGRRTDNYRPIYFVGRLRNGIGFGNS